MNKRIEEAASLGCITPPRTLRTEAEIIASWNTADEMMVSIHCATFNHADFIEDAINGFLIQETSFPFEVLINDDASTDNTAEIVRQYTEKYPNIIFPLYQTTNTYSKGYKTSFFNLMRVKGKYTALCEGDDFWLDKNKLQKQVDYLEKNPDVVMCGHDVIQIDSDGKVIKSCELDLSKGRLYSQNNIALGINIPSKSTIWRSNLPCPSSKMPFGDTFLFSYYGNFGKAYNFKEKMSVYRIHAGGVWSGIDREKQLKGSYYLYKNLPYYTLPKFRAISYFRFLLFLQTYKTTLDISNKELINTASLVLKNIRINNGLYILSQIVSKFPRVIAIFMGINK